MAIRITRRRFVSAAGAALGSIAMPYLSRAADRPQLARERQFARELVSIERGRRNLPAGSQNPERDRQVEATGLLRQVGGREVDGDPPHREVEAAGL